MKSTLTEKELSRFIGKIEKCPDSGCWNWRGYIDNRGYGQVKIRRLRQTALKTHRVSVCHFKEKSLEEIKNLVVLHSCDNTICCNPEHLSLGTTQENVDDKVRKHRQAKGSRHGGSKLKEKDVINILSKYNNLSIKDLSELYNVSESTIRKIKNRTNWKHIKV